MKDLSELEGQNPASGEKLQGEYCEFNIQREILVIRTVSEGSEYAFISNH